MPETETHIAGLEVAWDGRYLRQRCAWCGTVLLDYDLETLQSSDGGVPAPWPLGALVRQQGGSSWVEPTDPSDTHPEESRAPEDACVRLDPAVTR